MKVFLTKTKPYLDFISLQKGDCVLLRPNLVKGSKETDPNE